MGRGANAMRPAIIQTFSALLGKSVTEDHPARAYFTERYARVRPSMAAVLRTEYGDLLPNGLTPEHTAPLLDPEPVDMTFEVPP
ncbi:hypothetical protein BIV25_02400 [Streptomyces sp. MUSC 14]|nr:hypothetical protein BIV25_02400 [Streptomyces sp. MUSC 14]